MNNQVTILINSLVQGGAEKVSLRISDIFEKNNITSNYVIVNNDIFYKTNKKIILLSNKVKVSKLEKIYLLSKYFKNKNTVICFSLDLACYLIILRFLGKFKGKVICRFINNPDNEVHGLTSTIKRKFLFFILKKSDFVICQSKKMQEILTNKYCFNRQKIITIYNPIEKNTFPEITQESDNTLNLLFVGRLTYQKNIDDIIKIALILIKKNVEFIWKIIGDGEEFIKFETLIKENNLCNHIQLLGSQKNTSLYYQWADITTLVSHYEGMPNVLLESIAHNTPVISYNCISGPAEIIKENINGFLIPLYNVEKFADKLTEIEQIKKMKSNDLYNSIPEFHPEIIFKEYIKIL
ncbi:glycosyltransferase [Proteus terrae]|uniref:glycosyltransferase n=1 Tax=Proteus terrae TaxID=1574161 RepID=UPI003524A347